jgi:hypothetical protein
VSYSDDLLALSPLFYGLLAEASGTTLVDSSGNAHDGTWPAAPTFGVPGLLTGDPDTATDFQGPTTGGHAQIPTGTWMDTTTLTIVAWIKRESASSTGYILSRDGSSGVTRDWRLFLNNSTGRLDFAVWNAAGTVVTLSPTTVLAQDTRYCVAAKYDGTNMKLFLDGVQIGTVAHSGNVRTTAQKICIGSFNESSSNRFNGVMGKIALFGTALSDADILALYESGSTAPVAPSLELAGTQQADVGAFTVSPIVDVTLAGTQQADVGAFATNVDTPAAVDLAGTERRETISFTLAAQGNVSLAGTQQADVGAFSADVSKTFTLAGTERRDTAAFTAVIPPTAVLAGTQRADVAAFALAKPPTTDLGRVSSRRRNGYGIATWTPPVVPAPLPAAGYRLVKAQAFGPQTMHGSEPVYAVSEAYIPRTRQRILIDGVDFTYFRGAITPNVTYTLLEPLLYGPADLDLIQVVATEELGVDDLAPLRKYAVVIVQDVLDDVVVRTAWKGFINGFGVSGRNVTIELGGEAHGRADLRNRQPVTFPRINDLGHQIADAITDLGLPHHPPLGVVTGIETMTTGATGHLEHIQGLIAKAWTRAGRQWTVMPDPETGVYETHRKDGVTIHATAFIDDARTVINVRRDISDEPNRIYGSGVTPAGMRVRNAKAPGLFQGPVPPFPGHMEMGDTGEGVRLLIGRLQAMGYLGLREAAGGYDEDVYDAVVELQKDGDLFDEGFIGTAVPGEVNLVTWRLLYDLDVTSASLEWAHIEPMAQTRKVRPWRRSGSGTIMGVNPGHDASVLPVDLNLDYGTGMRRAQMFEHSRTKLHDSEDSNWIGDITFHSGALLRGEVAIGAAITDDDVMEAGELLPGMNLFVPNFQGGTLFHVAASQPNAQGVFSATIDTRFRDAMEAWEVMDRNKESRRDPARRRNQQHRSSTIVKDSIGEWDELGGLLGQDVTLEPGWNVFEVVGAAEGVIAKLRLVVQSIDSDGTTVEIEGHEFACAVFGRPITAERLNNLIPKPLTSAGTKMWESQRGELDGRWILYSAGTRDEPCGYSPGRKHYESTSDEVENPDYAPDADENTTGTDDDEFITVTTEESWGVVTGKHVDDAGFRYASESRTRLYPAVWVGDEAKILTGRIMWPQLEAGV